MSKCKYCKVALLDRANIRCDSCDAAWRDGFGQGESEILEKIQKTTRHLLNFLGVS